MPDNPAPEPMLPSNGPGWHIEIRDDEGEIISTYQLWAPRTDEQARHRGAFGSGTGRDHWAACWEMNGGRDGNFVHANTAAEALAAFATCPRRAEANAAVAALLDAAHDHTDNVDEEE